MRCSPPWPFIGLGTRPCFAFYPLLCIASTVLPTIARKTPGYNTRGRSPGATMAWLPHGFLWPVSNDHLQHGHANVVQEVLNTSLRIQGGGLGKPPSTFGVFIMVLTQWSECFVHNVGMTSFWARDSSSLPSAMHHRSAHRPEPVF